MWVWVCVRSVLQGCFARLVAHLRKSMEFRFSMGVVDNIVAKYFATVVGYYIVSRPFLSTAPSHLDALSSSEMMEEYYKSGRMLVNLAGAVGRIVLAGRELTRLSGFTARVYDLLDKVTGMTREGGAPFEIREDASSESKADVDGIVADAAAGKEFDRELLARLQQWAARCDERARLFGKPDPLCVTPTGKGGGQIVVQDGADIEFDNASLVSPDGKLLVKNLSFKVQRGVNVMVTGPNGSGKSSLFRVIGGLWPLHSGRLIKPPVRTHPPPLFYYF
jgi:ATP-binding cassette subfamily D (ALD) protein 3